MGFSRAAAMASDEHGAGGVERVATWLTLACAVHCMAVPLVTSFAPLFDLGSFDTPWVEQLLVGSVIVLAVVSSVLGYRRHRDVRVPAFVLSALSLYLVGHALEGRGALGSIVSVASALLLSVALFFGARRSHAHSESCAHS